MSGEVLLLVPLLLHSSACQGWAPGVFPSFAPSLPIPVWFRCLCTLQIKKWRHSGRFSAASEITTRNFETELSSMSLSSIWSHASQSSTAPKVFKAWSKITWICKFIHSPQPTAWLKNSKQLILQFAVAARTFSLSLVVQQVLYPVLCVCLLVSFTNSSFNERTCEVSLSLLLWMVSKL